MANLKIRSLLHHLIWLWMSLFFLVFDQKALAVEGYYGSTWGEIFHDDDQLVGTGAMGYANQGIDWLKLPGEILVTTYGEVRYRFRSENRPYFNAYGEALGFEFRKSSLHMGIDYLWERFPELAAYSSGLEYYFSYYYDWDFKKMTGSKFEGLPGSVWGILTHNDDQLIGNGAMGFVNQGIDWKTFPGKIVLNTFGELRYRLRSENRPYYNAYGEALGIELRKSSFHLGVDYLWERYPELADYSNKVELYFTWFLDWDLKHKETTPKSEEPMINGKPFSF